MTRKSKRVSFQNSDGIQLSGIVDWNSENTHAFCVFAHCFTCTKDLKAIVRISRNLADRGFGVLRFDFTGLGGSGGQFHETTFQNNCEDVRAAVNFVTNEYEAPRFLIGHSLGGAAQMMMASQFPSIQGIATIASPSDTRHLSKTLQRMNPAIRETGQGGVSIGGFTYLVKEPMLDVLEQTDLETPIRNNGIPHLIFHSPVDDTLAISHAEKIFEWVTGPRTFVTLDGSDHLLVQNPNDVDYVADQFELWANRILSA